MSTIHRPVELDLWWYVAGAVLAGAILSLMLLDLRSSSSGSTVTFDETGATTQTHYASNRPACFAGDPVPDIELPGAARLGPLNFGS
jgi:hypothetical protein